MLGPSRGQVSVPVMIVVGLQDEIVPPFHAKRLRDAAVASPKVTYSEVPNGSHNDTVMKAGQRFVAWTLEFLVENLDGISLDSLDDAAASSSTASASDKKTQ